MNPLKVKWSRTSARVRVFNSWILVRLGLHRRAPRGLRAKVLKAADWLEATVERMATSNGDQHQLQQHKRPGQHWSVEATSKVFRELQEEMAAIHSHEKNIKENIENIKGKFLQLLDVCGIKDADVPLFDEPNSLQHNRQTLITSFGTMSKKPSHATTRRISRHARRDPSIYADMLIEQLLAEANAMVDSDTSPPRAAGQQTQDTPSQKFSDENCISLTPVQVTFPFSNPNSQPETQFYPAPPVSGNSDSQVDTRVNSHSTVVHTPNIRRQNRHCSTTTDSGLTGSDHSPQASSKTNSYVPMRRDHTDHNLIPTTHNINTTLGSTPELPASESSDTLDVKFASLFDILETPESQRFKHVASLLHHTPAFQAVQNSSSPELPQAPSYDFPVHYSQSYAEQIYLAEAIIDSAARSHLSIASCPSTASPTRLTASFSCDRSEVCSMGSSVADESYIYHEPLVVCLPPNTPPRPCKQFDKHDHNINKSYKPHLEDKNAGIDSDTDSERPPLPPRRPLTDTKLGRLVVKSGTKEVGNVWLSSPQLESSAERTLQYIQQSFDERSDLQDSFISHQISYDTPSRLDTTRNLSWSHHDLPNMSDLPHNSMVSMSTGKAHCREKQRCPGDRYITVRSHKALSPPEGFDTPLSSSKRRRCNDQTPLTPIHVDEKPFPARSARQRLSFTPVSSPTRSRPTDHLSPDFLSSPSSKSPPKSNRLRRKKRQSPAMRRLMEEKENNALSPGHPNPTSRKPFSSMYNLKPNITTDLHSTSSNSQNTSDAYPKSSDTSPELPLPSREDELRDRDAYYSDFTVDRQHKIDNVKGKLPSSQSSGEDQEKQYMFEDPASSQLMIRTVEGAESSPSDFVFRPPPSNLRAPRAATRAKKRASPLKSSQRPRPVYPCDKVGAPESWPSTSSRSSEKSERMSSKRHSQKMCTSHPMASSTLIMDSETSSPDVESVGSVYYWSLEEESGPCNLEKSYIRSTSTKKKQIPKCTKNLNMPRPPTSVGQDRSAGLFEDEKSFEFSALVSRIDETVNRTSKIVGKQINSMIEDNSLAACTNGSDSQSSIPRTSTRSTLSGQGVVAGAPSYLRGINKSGNSHISEAHSFMASSNQATTSSMYFNRAKASIVCSSNEVSEVPAPGPLSRHSRHISASEPNLRHLTDDATHSLVPSDTDTTPERFSESSVLEERLEIPGKSSTSGSSSCTAARCRPRILRESSEKPTDDAALECTVQPHPNQDLLDSILTDSPRSVNSSGIFVPHNSYNSPVESVGSHNGYSSTVSSSVSSDNNYRRVQPGVVAPPPTPPHSRPHQENASRNVSTLPSLSKSRETSSKVSQLFDEFKRPFTPAPHINLTLRPVTRNQGVTAEAYPPTPHRPLSVRSDPLTNKSVFTVPPGVVTGPPKIKDKKSLVKKFKKFSSHFYKKTEKIQTLANL